MKRAAFVIGVMLVAGSVMAKEPKNTRLYENIDCPTVQEIVVTEFAQLTLWHYRWALWSEEKVDDSTTLLAFTGSGLLNPLECKFTTRDNACYVICMSPPLANTVINKSLKPVDTQVIIARVRQMQAASLEKTEGGGE